MVSHQGIPGARSQVEDTKLSIAPAYTWLLVELGSPGGTGELWGWAPSPIGFGLWDPPASTAHVGTWSVGMVRMGW